MKPACLRFMFAAGLGAVALPVLAHDLQYSVEDARAVVARLYYVDAKPFSFEAYEIYRVGEKLPYQVGRTDSAGRIAFLPDRAGNWRIKVMSEDGHGLDFNLATDAAARVEARDKPVYERYGRVVVGVAVILGLFGVLSLSLKKKSS
jgi:nickel transport protein